MEPKNRHLADRRDRDGDVLDHTPEPVVGRVNGWRKMIVLSILLSAVSILLSAVLFALILNEAGARKDQNCLLFLAEYENDKHEARSQATRLEGTLDYLGSLSPAQLKTNLNRRVAANVDTLREEVVLAKQEVKGSTPPDYCNKEAK